jgi:uncharacterized protein HemX
VKLDVKTLITLFTIVAVGAGFYYTTQYRLDSLEQETQELKVQVQKLETTVKRMKKQQNNKTR